MIDKNIAYFSSILDQLDTEWIVEKNKEYIKFTDKNFLTLDIESLTKYGVKVTKNYDESITLDGQCEVSCGLISPIITEEWNEDQLPPGQYKFVIKNDYNQFVNPNYLRVEVVGLGSNESAGTKLLDSYHQDNDSFTIDSSYKYHYFRLWIGNEHKFENETYYLMCVDSHEIDYEYEPSKISLEWALQQIIDNKLLEIDGDLDDRMDEINAWLWHEIEEISETTKLIHPIPIATLSDIWDEVMNDGGN